MMPADLGDWWVLLQKLLLMSGRAEAEHCSCFLTPASCSERLTIAAAASAAKYKSRQYRQRPLPACHASTQRRRESK